MSTNHNLTNKQKIQHVSSCQALSLLSHAIIHSTLVLVLFTLSAQSSNPCTLQIK